MAVGVAVVAGAAVVGATIRSSNDASDTQSHVKLAAPRELSAPDQRALDEARGIDVTTSGASCGAEVPVAPSLYPGDTRCVSIAAADLDGDHRDDRYVLYESADGNRTVKAVTSVDGVARVVIPGRSDEYNGILGVQAIRDYNADGHPDVLVALTGGGMVTTGALVVYHQGALTLVRDEKGEYEFLGWERAVAHGSVVGCGSGPSLIEASWNGSYSDRTHYDLMVTARRWTSAADLGAPTVRRTRETHDWDADSPDLSSFEAACGG